MIVHTGRKKWVSGLRARHWQSPETDVTMFLAYYRELLDQKIVFRDMRT